MILAMLFTVLACEAPPLAPDPLVAGIQITPGEVSIAAGESMDLAAHVETRDGPLAGARVSWSSTDTAVARITPAGRVTGVRPGHALALATYFDASAEVEVIVVSTAERAQPGQATEPDQPAQPTQPTQRRTLFGLHMDLTYDGYAWRRERALGLARELGVEVSRSSFLWHHIERERGTRDWSRPDAVVAELEASGIEPVFAVYGSPPWASEVDPATASAHLYVPEEEAAFGRWLAAYVDFMREAAARYRGRVRKWELWNEQNEHYFWKPKPNVDRYVRFYRAIHAVLKEADPANEVAMGGLAGLCCTGPQNISGRAFLQAMYDRGVYPEIVNIHPYAMKHQAPEVTLAWENNFTDIEMIRKVMVDAGQGGRPIWVTEWGWTTSRVSEAEQAEYVARSLAMLVERYPYVTLATYFLDYDREPTYYHGLVTSDWRMKPAALRFQAFLRERRAR